MQIIPVALVVLPPVGLQSGQNLGKPAHHIGRAFPLAVQREGQTVYFRPLPFALALALGASSTMGSASTAVSAMAASGLTDLRTS